MIRKLFAFGLAVVLALMPVQAFGKTVSVTNVSYEDVYKRQADLWYDHWSHQWYCLY